MKTIRFNDPAVFERLEDKAIDGVLDYSDFPPAEYKYFSKLSKVGYNNRVKGWAVAICERKQKELRADYARDKESAEIIMRRVKRCTEINIKYGRAITAIYKAETAAQVYDNALTALELITGEDGFKGRIEKKLERERGAALNE